MRHGWTLASLALASVLAACGGGTNYGGMPSTSAPAPDSGTVTPTGNATDGGTASDGGTTALAIHIKNMAFSPESLTVPAGGTVQVFNDDSPTPHSVTSEATAAAYVPGSVAGVSFDTGIFTGSRSFTIPASAANGTVIPYYCRVHLSTMVDAGKVQITIGPASSSPTTTPTPTPTPTTPAPSTPSMPTTTPGY